MRTSARRLSVARLLAGVPVLLFSVAARAHAMPQASDLAMTAPAPTRFEFTEAARDQLQDLWRSSSDSKHELVACLGGYAAGPYWRLTAVAPLQTVAGDSLNVSAVASLAECGPPQWLGTVHTHVALRGDLTPYATFSGADRGVMRLWTQRWGSPGVFCVLYSNHDAHCEMDGGYIAGPETRASY